MKNSQLKIISLPVDNGGCGNLRIRQPFEMIQHFTDSEAHVIEPESDNMLSIADALAVADVVVYRQGGEVGIPAMKNELNRYYQAKGIRKEWTPKWVLDIDDNIEMVSPYSQHYEEYGVEEFYDNNAKKWIWKDGVADFDIKRNRERLSSLINAMKSADLVTVTTEKLAQYARQYNKSVAILPNCINLDHWWKLPLKKNEQLRVGWSGGISHYEDWHSIKEPLNKLLKEYQFKLIMSGSNFSGIIDNENKHLVETHGWTPFKGYSYQMMCMALDFAVIPLADTPFNHYKSSVKWYEMSSMGIPSVVSNILPYSEDVLHDKTGLLYKSQKEFYDSMVEMLTRPGFRNHLGKAARRWVEDNRDAKKCATMWVEAYGHA